MVLPGICTHILPRTSPEISSSISLVIPLKISGGMSSGIAAGIRPFNPARSPGSFALLLLMILARIHSAIAEENTIENFSGVIIIVVFHHIFPQKFLQFFLRAHLLDLSPWSLNISSRFPRSFYSNPIRNLSRDCSDSSTIRIPLVLLNFSY